MSGTKSNSFSFVLVISRSPVFQGYKEILSGWAHPALSCCLCKVTLKLPVIWPLTLFYHLSIIIAQQVGRKFGQNSV